MKIGDESFYGMMGVAYSVAGGTLLIAGILIPAHLTEAGLGMLLCFVLADLKFIRGYQISQDKRDEHVKDPWLEKELQRVDVIFAELEKRCHELFEDILMGPEPEEKTGDKRNER